MAWIQIHDESAAGGLLANIYAAARKRAGRVYNILKIQSLNPPALQASMALYLETVRADSPVPRALREMIATVVSRANHCHY